MNIKEQVKDTLSLSSGEAFRYYSLPAFAQNGHENISRFPFCLKIILEQTIRLQGHPAFSREHVSTLSNWKPNGERSELPFMPARVLLQDFTGVPCVVDLAALRSAVARAGKDPSLIEPSIPVDLIVDHSVQLDSCGCSDSLDINLDLEFKRNRERYMFLRWGQNAFDTLRVLPPGLGICHQINMELLGTCVAHKQEGDNTIVYPDSLVGTDSHTPMINSMGIVGWGVGGIEAEAAMLGQPIPILTPIITGVKLTGEISAGVTPTDVALTVVHMLREHGVVGHFVEFFGPGVNALSLADRAPLSNMAPEYGATMGYFPVDDATLDYLRMTGRSEKQVELVERYFKAQGLFRTGTENTMYSDVLELDLSSVESSVAGPKRPQDRVSVSQLGDAFSGDLVRDPDDRGFGVSADHVRKTVSLGEKGSLQHGSVIIASITSCTNTSNPTLLLGAGIMAKKAVERGLSVPDWVKTSFAPGSQIAEDYLKKSGLLPFMEKLGFNIAAYGCATCIGNSGPVAPEVEEAVKSEDLIVAAVLSGNRNFEGRIHPLTQANYLCSPPLVLAYALAGRVDLDLTSVALGVDSTGASVFLKDIWPSPEEISSYMSLAADPQLYKDRYANVANAVPSWNALPAGEGAAYQWNTDSTYIQEPPWVKKSLEHFVEPEDIHSARVLGYFGDFVTTDHISPAGAIKPDSPAGQYLQEHGVGIAQFNSYGSRRGNHEVMLRGTFANIRLRNKLASQTGGYTCLWPDGKEISIYEAAMQYQSAGTPLVVLAGKMYGAGSSRDWAAKGTALLGVRAVIAESYERIHRSNLVEMGVLPLEFVNQQTAETLGLTGRETIAVSGIADGLAPGALLEVVAEGGDTPISFSVLCRIDSPIELEYYRHGGILPYVLREAVSG
jgi:aconitate hydratase